MGLDDLKRIQTTEHRSLKDNPEWIKDNIENVIKWIDRSKIWKTDNILDWEWEKTKQLRKILTDLVLKHQQISQNLIKNKKLGQSLLTSWDVHSHIWTERPVMSLNWAVRNYIKKHKTDNDFLWNPDKDFIAYLNSDRDLIWFFDILDLNDDRKNLYRELYEEVWISPIKEIKLQNNNILFLKCENKNWMWGNHYARYRIVHLALAESLKLITPWDWKTIVEMTSWSSWCSLAKACKKLWYRLEMFIPDNFPYGRKHPIEENKNFDNPEYFNWEDKICTEIIEIPNYIDWTREALFWKYLPTLNSLDCTDIYSPDHASEQFNLILKVFKRIARESIEQIKKWDSETHIDYAVLARWNWTSTHWMAQEFKKEAENQWKDTKVIAYRWTSQIFWLLSTWMPDVFKNNLEKLVNEWIVDKWITAVLDKEKVYRMFEKEYPEVREWWDSTLLWLQIIAEMAEKEKWKNFFSVVYDWREKYLSKEELEEWNKNHKTN